MRLNQITERRSAPLYHGTTFLYMLMMLEKDRLSASNHHGYEDEPHGPRLSRSYKVADKFTEDHDGDLGNGGVISLDQERLTYNYKIQPYADYMSDDPMDRYRTEAEEVVVADRVYPLSRYLTGIYLRDADIQDVMNGQYIEWWTSGKYPVWPDKSPDDVMLMIANLANHSLRKT